MCAPSTSASVIDDDLAVAQPREIGRRRSSPCGSTPIATAMSWISALANRRSRFDFQRVEHLAAHRQIAWYCLSRACLAEPPAESPSTRNSSLSRRCRRFAVGELLRAAPRRSRLSCVLDLLHRLRCAHRLPDRRARRSCGPSRRGCSATPRTGRAPCCETSFSASRFESFSLVWPWNCGSSTARRQDEAQLRDRHVVGLQPDAARHQAVMLDERLDRLEQRRRASPASCVPPAGVGIRLT